MIEFLHKFATGFMGTLLDMAPYLLFGFFCAGLLSVLISGATVRRHLGKGRFLPVIKAALFGVPLPLCSCGVIPVTASLRRQGASRGAACAFLLATPQTGIDGMIVIYSMLGLVFALYVPMAAFLSGILVGMLVLVAHRNIEDPHMELAEQEAAKPASDEVQAPVWQRVLRHGFLTLGGDIALPLLLGLTIAGLISAFVEPGALAGRAGSGLEAKLILLLAGIPLYVCATASVPIAASLILAGISPGTALVFLMSGPATNAATLTTLWKLMGRRAALIYLAGVAFAALTAGTLMDWVYQAGDLKAHAMQHEMLPSGLRIAAAVALVSLLVYARFIRRWWNKRRALA